MATRTAAQYFGNGGGKSDSWEWLCVVSGKDPRFATKEEVRAWWAAELLSNSIDDTGFFDVKLSKAVSRG